MTDKLTAARTAVHAALVAADLPDIGEDRTHRLPQWGSYPLPCAWVGLPTVTDPQNQGAQLELPVVIAFDGAQDVQVEAVDAQTSSAWDALRKVDLGAGKARPTSATTERLGPEGASTLAVVIAVSVPIGVRTLCTPGQLNQL